MIATATLQWCSFRLGCRTNRRVIFAGRIVKLKNTIAESLLDMLLNGGRNCIFAPASREYRDAITQLNQVHCCQV